MTVALLVLIGVASADVVIWPLRSGAAERDALAAQVRRADLVAEKEARYREIRDAELDRETGKVSAEDWRRIDRELRADAARILEELDKT